MHHLFCWPFRRLKVLCNYDVNLNSFLSKLCFFAMKSHLSGFIFCAILISCSNDNKISMNIAAQNLATASKKIETQKQQSDFNQNNMHNSVDMNALKPQKTVEVNLSPLPSSGLRRLTRLELYISIVDVLGQPVSMADLPRDNSTSGFAGDEAFSLISIDELQKYENALVKVVASLPIEAELQKCSGKATCAADFLNGYLSRAMRGRPKAETESLLANVSTSLGAGETDGDKVRRIIMSNLMSTYFLYRTESGANLDSKKMTNAEIAAKISFLATSSPPDDELLKDILNADFTDANLRIVHVNRLLEKPAAILTAAKFIKNWLGVKEEEIAKKKDFNPTLIAEAEDSFLKTVEHVMFNKSKPGGVAELFSTKEWLVGPQLKTFLEMGTAEDNAITVVNIEQTYARSGIWEHPAIFSSHSHDVGRAPLLTGAGFLTRVLCQSIGTPPADAGAQFAKAMVPKDATLRQTLELGTAVSPVCVGCHSRINPLAFAFLPFDATARLQKNDSFGMPWNTISSLKLGADIPDISFTNGRDLVNQLVKQSVFTSCTAKMLTRFSQGQRLDPRHKNIIETLSHKQKTGASWAELLTTIVADPEFIVSKKD